MPILPLLFLVGCKAVPEPPGAFAALVPYLFEHHADEDPEAMVLGLQQLELWLDANQQEAVDGFTVNPPSEEGFNAVDEHERSIEGMVGLSMATVSLFPVESNAWALVSVDQDQIFPKTFDEYHRIWESGDAECFSHKDCDRAQCVEELASSFPLGLKSESTAMNQYLWVDLGEEEERWAMVHRNWQIEPPVVNHSSLEVDQQAYLNLFIPMDEGAYRLQAQWTVYSADNSTPEDMASQLVIHFFQGMHDDLEAWLQENPAPDDLR